MTPADRRITELIDKWLTSIDLHLGYSELSDAAYARAQPWGKHDRPTRWVLEVARQKIIELKSQCETRQAMGDERFAESLELMAFLANLVGIQHIQRFIPLAEPAREDKSSITATVETPVTRPAPARAQTPGDEATREMPKLKAQGAPARKEPQKPASAPAPAKRVSPQAPKTGSADNPMVDVAVVDSGVSDIKIKIIADAVRLLNWGKPWHELAELIGRIANRPPVAEIRKILRAHRSEIETKAAKTS
ncbi:MAG: hypothetical protein ABW106_07890 [Steroidobacteraceae bacterium]